MKQTEREELFEICVLLTCVYEGGFAVSLPWPPGGSRIADLFPLQPSGLPESLLPRSKRLRTFAIYRHNCNLRNKISRRRIPPPLWWAPSGNLGNLGNLGSRAIWAIWRFFLEYSLWENGRLTDVGGGGAGSVREDMLSLYQGANSGSPLFPHW